MTHTAANVINDAYRYYEDDVAGAITGQTALAAVDTNISIAAGTKFHVALLATETAGGDANNYAYSVEYRKNGGTWTDLTTTTTDPVYAVTPDNCTTADNASYGTTALTTGATIQATEYCTNGDAAANTSLNNASFEKTTCVVINTTGNAVNDTFEFRLTNNGTALNADTTIGTVTVSSIPSANTNVPLDAGSYSLTGFDATVSTATNTNVPLDAGSYTITGYSGNTFYYIPPLTGSYTITGLDATVSTAGANTNVPLDAGSYSLTGLDATVSAGNNVPLDAGSYTITGYSGNTSYYIPPLTGSYAITGFDANVNTAAQTNVPLDAGSYTLTGFTANLIVNDAIGLDAGTYAITGFDLAITTADQIALDAGTYTLTGQDLAVNTTANTTVALDSATYTLTGADIAADVSLSLAAGSYTLTGYTASVAAGNNVPLDAGTYVLSGQDATATVNRLLGLDAGTYTVSGFAATVTTDDQIALDAGSYAITGQNLAIQTTGNTTVPLDAGSYVITGYSGNTSYYLPPATGSYTITGQDLTVAVSGSAAVALGAGSYTITGYAYAFTPEIVGGTGVYTITGQDLTVSLAGDTPVALDSGTYSLTGLDVTLAVDDQIALDGGVYTLTGLDAAIATGATVLADAGSYTVTGFDTSIVTGDTISLDAGSYSLTGQDLSISVVGQTTISADAGSYALTGQSLSVVTAGAITLDAGSYSIIGGDTVIRTPVAPSASDPCREPVQIVEIVQPLCALVYGSAPCTASGTADQKCYNTRATCQDAANYDGSASLSLFFSRGHVAEQRIEGAPYIIPSLKSVSTAPTRINLASANPDAQGLGNRAVCNIEFTDHPHTDRRVDPYVEGRSWDGMDRGSFWSKWMVRNKYRQNIRINVYEGYAGQALADMTKRSYFLQSVQGPDSNGRVRIQGKDILARIEERKAQAPAASPGELYTDINAAATSFEVANAVEADYPASGTVRIGDELMTYSARATSTNGIELTGVVRGTDGTVAEDHSAEDAVQECLRYTNARPDDIIEDLLTTYGGISASFLNTTAWAAEVDSYLSFYRLNIVISEPTSVTELVSQVQENVLCYIWWDERTAQVEFKAIRGIDSAPPLITAESNIIEGTFSLTELPRERASRAWVFYQHRNYVDSFTDADSYRSQSIFADLESETDDLYGEASIRRVYAPWLTSGALADTTASKILTRFVDVPAQATLQMDAKDRDYWVGDTVTISHFLDVDEFGERRLRNWTIISAEETQPGEIVKYTLEDTTLYNRIYFIQAPGAGDYSAGVSDPFDGFIGDTSGLLSDGTTAARIA